MLSTRVPLIAMLLVALASPFFFSGCQSKEEPVQPPKEAGSPAASSGGKGTAVTFSGKGGDVIREESGRGVLPEGFPEDVPLPENGAVRLSQHRVKTDTFVVIINTDESPKDVIGYYEKEAPRRGWKVTQTTDFGPLISIEAVKDAHHLQVQVSREEKNTQVHLTLTPKSTP